MEPIVMEPTILQNLGEGIFLFMLSTMTINPTFENVEICVTHPKEATNQKAYVSCAIVKRRTFCETGNIPPEPLEKKEVPKRNQPEVSTEYKKVRS